ncbi:MAG TPA: hypothetical protein VNM92_11475 [Thermoanaerobaculia bacterium]|nr:hypothetical protein [Thermoanaerobaculia bacterium]
MELRIIDALTSLRDEARNRGARVDGRRLAECMASYGTFPPSELLNVAQAIDRLLEFGRDGLLYAPPAVVVDATKRLLAGRRAERVCDPWAGAGVLLSVAIEATEATAAFAISRNEDEASLGKSFVPAARWEVSITAKGLTTLPGALDVVVSVLPFGVRAPRRKTIGNFRATQPRGLDEEIITAVAEKLADDGVILVVVSGAFFPIPTSTTDGFLEAGVALEAAFAIPAGAFSPQTNISSYLLVLSKRTSDQLFVAELSLSGDNGNVISNFRNGREGDSPELGRLVEPQNFRGIPALKLAERLEEKRRHFGGRAVRLGDLATAVDLGRAREGFQFPERQNAIFIPTIGATDVVLSVDEFGIKAQNYAQVAIDARQSMAPFVARFLNSELGREIRDGMKTGFIPKLNTTSLKSITVFLPDIKTQEVVLSIEGKIAEQQNVILGLHHNIAELRRELWAKPSATNQVEERLGQLAERLSGELTTQVSATLDQWFETQPFPLASILRAWQATAISDHKTRYEHLLHFFEAASEFCSIILLSAFASNQGLYGSHKEKFAAALVAHKHSFSRATFGTWKFIVEYFGKQTRQLLTGDADARALCREIFGDETLRLPEMLSSKQLAGIVSRTNTMRNNWSGHGGVVGSDEARLRNERLLEEVQKFREAVADGWESMQLVHALGCRSRRGSFETDLAILMGSNSEFLKETRTLSTCLDVERLYLCSEESNRALQLLPLIIVEAAPRSQRNACYFFNRLDHDAARFVSYHFADAPELNGNDDAAETIRHLTEV